MSLGNSSFSIFDPELARRAAVLREADARLRRYPPYSLEHQIARLGYKQALKACAAWAFGGERDAA